jgi:hypothetical protein
MLPTEGREPKFIGRIGAELDLKTGLQAARLAALNALAVTRQALGSLDKVTRIVRLGVSVATREMFAINQRWPTVPRNCCLTSLEKTRTLTVYRWCRKPYARNASSSGSHFRGQLTTGPKTTYVDPFEPTAIAIPSAHSTVGRPATQIRIELHPKRTDYRLEYVHYGLQ